jgi:hypothetical protein
MLMNQHVAGLVKHVVATQILRVIEAAPFAEQAMVRLVDDRSDSSVYWEFRRLVRGRRNSCRGVLFFSLSFSRSGDCFRKACLLPCVYFPSKRDTTGNVTQILMCLGVKERNLDRPDWTISLSVVTDSRRRQNIFENKTGIACDVERSDPCFL